MLTCGALSCFSTAHFSSLQSLLRQVVIYESWRGTSNTWNLWYNQWKTELNPLSMVTWQIDPSHFFPHLCYACGPSFLVPLSILRQCKIFHLSSCLISAYICKLYFGSIWVKNESMWRGNFNHMNDWSRLKQSWTFAYDCMTKV